MNSLSALRTLLLLIRPLSHSLLHLLMPDVLLSLDMLLLDSILVELHLLVIHKFSEILELSLFGWTILIFILVLAILLFFLILRIVSFTDVKWLNGICFLFWGHL
jgi:hypothetical protein